MSGREEEPIIKDMVIYDTLQHFDRKAQDLESTHPEKASLCKAIKYEIFSGNYIPAIQYLRKGVRGIRWRMFWSRFAASGNGSLMYLRAARIAREGQNEIGNLEILINGLSKLSPPLLPSETSPSLKDLERSFRTP